MRVCAPSVAPWARNGNQTLGLAVDRQPRSTGLTSSRHVHRYLGCPWSRRRFTRPLWPGGRHQLSGSPWGTVAVNILGSFLLGLLIGTWGFTADGPRHVGLAIGLLGGFTTFSSFAMDTVFLWDNGNMVGAVTSVAISVIVGLAAAVAGLVLGRTLVQ